MKWERRSLVDAGREESRRSPNHRPGGQFGPPSWTARPGRFLNGGLNDDE